MMQFHESTHYIVTLTSGEKLIVSAKHGAWILGIVDDFLGEGVGPTIYVTYRSEPESQTTRACIVVAHIVSIRPYPLLLPMADEA